MSKEKLEILRYENFGHSFSLADLISETLSSKYRPPMTNIVWETYDAKQVRYGVQSGKMLRIKIVSVLEADNFTESSFSLERPINTDYGDYAKAYLNNGYLFFKGKESSLTPKVAVKNHIKKAFTKAIEEFENKYKSYGSDLNGVL